MSPWLSHFIAWMVGGCGGCMAMALLQAARDPLDVDARLNVDEVVPNGLMSNGWLPWFGGECPVHAGTLLTFRFRGEECDELSGACPERMRWSHRGTAADIVAYRIHQQQTGAA